MFGRKTKKLKFDASPRQLIVYDRPKDPISEQYRGVRTNIMYSSVEKSMQVILFTSSTPSEGKSTSAGNVAITYAQAGMKTLLIDADLRRPTMHYTFEVSNNRGLSSLIVNELDLENVADETQIPNLYLLTSGPIPPNPAELLSSKRLKQLLKIARETYDVVIIDSPPILSVSDAQILSGFVDGCILITNVRNNNKYNLKRAKASLEKANANILGVILNNKKLKTRENYYYYGGE